MVEPRGEMIVYRRQGASEVQLRPVNGTVWLTYEQMADLYATSRENIVQIIGRVLADGEVDESTCNSELQVRQEGNRRVRREVNLFNLDMVLAVGYRVTDGMLQGFNLRRLDGLGSVSHEAIEAMVDRDWPGFVEARRQREYAESWEVEATDISELLNIQRSTDLRGGDSSGKLP